MSQFRAVVVGLFVLPSLLFTVTVLANTQHTRIRGLVKKQQHPKSASTSYYPRGTDHRRLKLPILQNPHDIDKLHHRLLTTTSSSEDDSKEEEDIDFEYYQKCMECTCYSEDDSTSGDEKIHSDGRHNYQYCDCVDSCLVDAIEEDSTSTSSLSLDDTSPASDLDSSFALQRGDDCQVCREICPTHSDTFGKAAGDGKGESSSGKAGKSSKSNKGSNLQARALSSSHAGCYIECETKEHCNNSEDDTTSNPTTVVPPSRTTPAQQPQPSTSKKTVPSSKKKSAGASKKSGKGKSASKKSSSGKGGSGGSKKSKSSGKGKGSSAASKKSSTHRSGTRKSSQSSVTPSPVVVPDAIPSQSTPTSSPERTQDNSIPAPASPNDNNIHTGKSGTGKSSSGGKGKAGSPRYYPTSKDDTTAG